MTTRPLASPSMPPRGRIRILVTGLTWMALPAILMVAVVMVMATSGCASTRPVDTLDPAAKLLPLDGPIDAASLFPLREARAPASFTRLKRPGSTAIVNRDHIDDSHDENHDAPPEHNDAITIAPASDAKTAEAANTANAAGPLWQWAMGSVSTTMVYAADDGSRVAVSEASAEDGVVVHYETPLVFLPHGIGRAETPSDANDASEPDARHRYEGQTRVRVVDAKSGDQRESGECRYTVEALGQQRIRLGDQVVTAIIIRERRHLKLNMAESDVVITTGYVPDQGPVVQTVDEATTVMGLVRTTRHRRLERTEPFGL